MQYLHWAPEAGVGEGWENVAAIGVASVDGCYWAAAPPSFEGCATEAGGTKLREKLLLKPVKLKALVLGCGLALIGLTSAAWADNSNAQKCASPYYSGKIKGDSKYCWSENYRWTTDSKCKCPNPNRPEDKNVCRSTAESWPLGGKEQVYTCEQF